MVTLMLLDGNSLAYRAFFALPTDMATASGQVTNAVFGFTSMLINLLKDHRPEAIAVAFDRPEPTFRHAMVPDYKAGREAAPDILRQQMGLVRQVVQALRIPLLEVAGFEADDVIATLATEARDRGDDVVVVTGDRDAYQLVEDPHIKVLYNRRGVSDYVLYDEAGIVERTGVHPTLYPQYAALRGDPSDNLPGVPGVGPKTAAKLINAHGDLDGVFAHLDQATPKLRESLAAHEVQVRLNARATPLVRDVPMELALDDLTMGGWDVEEVRGLFNFLEFRTLWDRLLDAVGPPPGTAGAAGAAEPEPVEVFTVGVLRPQSGDASAALLDELAAGEGPLAVAVAWTALEGRSDLAGLALATDGDGAAWLPADQLDDPAVALALGRLVGPGGRPVSTHRAKEVMRGLDRHGVDLVALDLDTAIAAYLLDPAESGYLLEDLCPRYGGFELRSAEATPPGQLDLDGT
ncbi:MAG: 5'-3' exonuclease H3TH domain-containing protein, partial [Acidimicrobiales bacterium]